MRPDVADILGGRTRPPLLVVLGSPSQAADVVEQLGDADAVCYQMDLYQTDRLRAELDERGLAARVETLPDLWDLPADFQTAVYPAPAGGERELKLDVIEQAYHVLRPRGAFV